MLSVFWASCVLGQSVARVRAAGNADTAQVRSLLDAGANPNEIDNSAVKGWTPLMAAAKAGSAEVVRASGGYQLKVSRSMETAKSP
jgi:ankyrin repeat protein